MSSDGVKTLRALARRAPKVGWSVEDRGRRLLWRGPDGQTVWTAKTPDGTVSTTKTVGRLRSAGFPVDRHPRKAAS